MILRCLLLLGLSPLCALAGEVTLDHSDIPSDRAAQLRGAEVVATVCSGCHNLKYIKYQDLLNLGAPADKVGAWRGEHAVGASMQAQMSPEDARASLGATPPDLSLMAAAREGGGHYIYSYLTGYRLNDKGELSNRISPETRMPDVLGGSTAQDDAQRAQISSTAKDVSAFLIWAADPRAQERKRMGYYVLAYVAVMTLLLFLWKNRIWRDIDRRPRI